MTIKTQKSAVSLTKGGPKLVFTTTTIETIAECKEIEYSKRVAWHNVEGATPYKLHKSCSVLFDQYVEDAVRCLNSK